jgi:integrase
VSVDTGLPLPRPEPPSTTSLRRALMRRAPELDGSLIQPRRSLRAPRPVNQPAVRLAPNSALAIPSGTNVGFRHDAYHAQRRRIPDARLIFPAPRCGYLNLRNWRDRDWHPALEAAGVEPRGPNALRHTFATWFLIHSDDRWLLAKLMGTSVDMIEQHYGHLLAPHATRSREILDAIWDGFGRKLDATTLDVQLPTFPIPLNKAEN